MQGDLGGFVDRVIAEIQGHVLNVEIVEPIVTRYSERKCYILP